MSEANSTIDRRDLSTIGLPGYHVSADGRVWTMKRLVYGDKPGCTVAYDGLMKELKQRTTKQKPGYKVVVLVTAEKKQRTCLVHRLVLEMFVGPCPDGMECRHLDGNEKNNDLSNLAWGTPTENCADRSQHGRQCHMQGEKNGRHKISDEEAVEIRNRYAAGGTTYRELGEEYNTSPSNIRWIVIRGTWKHV